VTSAALVVAVIGAGPTGTGFLERFSASVPTMLPDVAIDVHLVDPFPPGAGRAPSKCWTKPATPTRGALLSAFTPAARRPAHSPGPVTTPRPFARMTWSPESFWPGWLSWPRSAGPDPASIARSPQRSLP
jgi:hypothetical protein